MASLVHIVIYGIILTIAGSFLDVDPLVTLGVLVMVSPILYMIYQSIAGVTEGRQRGALE